MYLIIRKLCSKMFAKNNDYRIPIDIRNICNSPVAVNYYGYTQPLLIEAKLNYGRGRPLFTLGETGNHPFIKAASNYLMTGKEESIREELEYFYHTVKPKCAAQLLNTANVIEEFRKLPPWGLVMPWETENPTEQELRVAESVRKENQQEKSSAGVEKGWAWTGPTHSEKIGIECRRLKTVIDSIHEHGYLRHDGSGGDIPVTILKDDEEWVWQARTGQHRAIALSALGYDTIPLRMVKLVRREDVASWPHVIDGMYTQQQALEVFDQIFYGELPTEINMHILNERERFSR